MANYERSPSVDEICEAIVAKATMDLRGWISAQGEESAALGEAESAGNRFYGAGAEGCWVVEGEPDEEGSITIDTIVVRLPTDHERRRKIWSALCEHLCERVIFLENPELYSEDVTHYFGQAYCLVPMGRIDIDVDE